MTFNYQLILLLVAVAFVAVLVNAVEEEDEIEKRAYTYDVYQWKRDIGGGAIRYEYLYAEKDTNNRLFIMESAQPGETQPGRDKTYFGFTSARSMAFYTLGAGRKCFAIQSDFTKEEVLLMGQKRHMKFIPDGVASVPMVLDGRGPAVSFDVKSRMLSNFPVLNKICGDVPIIMATKLNSLPANSRYAKIQSMMGRVNVVVPS